MGQPNPQIPGLAAWEHGLTTVLNAGAMDRRQFVDPAWITLTDAGHYVNSGNSPWLDSMGTPGANEFTIYRRTIGWMTVGGDMRQEAYWIIRGRVSWYEGASGSSPHERFWNEFWNHSRDILTAPPTPLPLDPASFHTTAESMYNLAMWLDHSTQRLQTEINRFDTGSSGFEGSAAEAFRTVLENLRAEMNLLRQDLETSRNWPQMLHDNGDAANTFWQQVRTAWDTWSGNVVHQPSEMVRRVMNQIETQIDELGRRTDGYTMTAYDNGLLIKWEDLTTWPFELDFGNGTRTYDFRDPANAISTLDRDMHDFFRTSIAQLDEAMRLQFDALRNSFDTTYMSLADPREYVPPPPRVPDPGGPGPGPGPNGGPPPPPQLDFDPPGGGGGGGGFGGTDLPGGGGDGGLDGLDLPGGGGGGGGGLDGTGLPDGGEFTASDLPGGGGFDGSGLPGGGLGLPGGGSGPGLGGAGIDGLGGPGTGPGGTGGGFFPPGGFGGLPGLPGTGRPGVPDREPAGGGSGGIGEGDGDFLDDPSTIDPDDLPGGGGSFPGLGGAGGSGTPGSGGVPGFAGGGGTIPDLGGGSLPGVGGSVGGGLPGDGAGGNDFFGGVPGSGVDGAAGARPPSGLMIGPLGPAPAGPGGGLAGTDGWFGLDGPGGFGSDLAGLGAAAAAAAGGGLLAAGAANTAGMGGYPPMMPPMGGMGGAGGQQEKDRERTTWLAEEEEVWGTDPDVAPSVIGRDDVPDGPGGDRARPASSPQTPGSPYGPGRGTGRQGGRGY